MKTNKNKMAILIACITFAFTSCSDDDDTMVQPDNTITGIASRTSDLSILVQALTKADLATTLQGNGPFTVFAPTNAAFTSFLSANGFANLDAVPVPALREILLNHVVIGDFESTDLVNNTYIKTLGKGSASSTNTLSMYVNTTSGVRLNGVSSVAIQNSSSLSNEEWIAKVASKGGTTESALKVFNQKMVTEAIVEAIHSANTRAVELGS